MVSRTYGMGLFNSSAVAVYALVLSNYGTVTVAFCYSGVVDSFLEDSSISVRLEGLISKLKIFLLSGKESNFL